MVKCMLKPGLRTMALRAILLRIILCPDLTLVYIGMAGNAAGIQAGKFPFAGI